jgi:hypothetical protein
MTTSRKIINTVHCSSSDWPNLLASTKSIANVEMDKTIQAILHHPLKDLVSVPFMFSFAYRQARKWHNPEKAAMIACKEVEEKLSYLY